ncbi:MAG: aspartate/glutamate racemase family protein [Actinomycetes bacterium]
MTITGGPTTPLVGILAGLGPLAGAYFYRRLVELTSAEDDQEHLSVVLISDPTIPPRSEHLLHGGRSPAPELIQGAQRLVRAGATLIAIPSSTSHAYYSEIAGAVDVPVLNLLAEAVDAVRAVGWRRVAIVATTATVAAQLYAPYLPPGIVGVTADPRTQEELQKVVDDVKRGGDLEAGRDQLAALLSRECWESCDGVLLACTELPLVQPRRADRPFVSATDVLVRAVLRESRKVVHPWGSEADAT